MTEFVFSVKLTNGATFNYSLRANEKLDAFSKIKSRFPSSTYKLISPVNEETEY